MNASAGISTTGEKGKKGEKPEWGVTAALVAVLSLVLRLTEDRSWWVVLLAPLFVLAVGAVAHAWRATARSRWRMGPLEWVFLVLTHIGLVLSLARAFGWLPR